MYKNQDQIAASKSEKVEISKRLDEEASQEPV